MPSFNRSNRLEVGRIGVFDAVASCAVAAALAITMAVFPATEAFAAHEDTAGSMADSGSPSESEDKELYGDEKIEVDILADELKSAQADSVMAQVKASATKAHARILKARIPEQQERSDAAARNLYKLQNNSYDVVEMLLSSQSIDSFILQLEYLHDVTQTNVHQIKQAYQLKRETKRALADLNETSSKALQQVKEASDALKEAQEVRIARAAEGISSATAQAPVLGGKNSVEKKTTSSKDKNKDKSSKSSKSKTTYSIEATTDTSAIDDGADWSQSKEEFVAEWAPRLDAYLEGSPLYGQGENFAKSAWKYCIDPRWSAAISCTESSKGAICIRAHNAWGWGAAEPNPAGNAAEWGSWAEAIDAHSRGLSEGYGYTISMRGAKTYCPVNWQFWYNTTLGEMAQI